MSLQALSFEKKINKKILLEYYFKTYQIKVTISEISSAVFVWIPLVCNDRPLHSVKTHYRNCDLTEQLLSARWYWSNKRSMFSVLLKRLALVSDNNGKKILSYTTTAFCKELSVIGAFESLKEKWVLLWWNQEPASPVEWEEEEADQRQSGEMITRCVVDFSECLRWRNKTTTRFL